MRVFRKIFLPDFSLYRRLSVGLSCMLIPLVLVIGATFFSQNQIIENLAEIAEETTEEITPVLHIHMALHEVMMPVHDYLIHGDQDRERARFESKAAAVDRAFAEALSGPFSLNEETQNLSSAYDQWQMVRESGRRIIALHADLGNPRYVAAMEEFDRLTAASLAPIDAFYSHAREEIAAAEHEVASIRDTTRLFIGLMLAIGLGLALSSALVLSRSILRPMQELKRGVKRLEAGDLVHRVELSSRDEFGQLAAAFNRMAQELERNHRMLEELSYRDELTGLNNRRRFMAELEREIGRGARYGNVFALLILDIDHFKGVNDRFGHTAGDRVLQQTSRAMQEVLRHCDMLARIGGEEFAVLLPETRLEAALEVAEKLRGAVETMTVRQEDGVALSVTVSGGVANFPEMAEDRDALIKLADEGLYRAKEGGRNRICIPAAGPEPRRPNAPESRREEDRSRASPR